MEQSDLVELLDLPAFKRFLFRIADSADMLRPANWSEDRRLNHTEGRRSLGFDIFRWADEAMSASHPSAIPISTLMEALKAEMQRPGGTNDQPDPDPDDEPERQL